MSERHAQTRLHERWQSMLLPLGREVASVLGNWLDRLDSLFGSLDAADRRPSDQLDGYDGISRRGTPERLLLSEWVLADRHPLEFIRRASMGEQLHHELARATDLHPTQKSVVLFDAGPSQLGTPRLAHLALLLLLHRRASERGIGFAWGILQQPAPGLRAEFGLAACKRLLAARTAAAPGPEEFARWTARLEELVDQRSDVRHEVVVVSDQHPAFGRIETAHVAVSESEELAEESLIVRLRRVGRAERTVVLPLPPQAMRAQLLRVSERGAPPLEGLSRPLDSTSGLLFLGDGERLVAREWGGRLRLYRAERSNEVRPATLQRTVDLATNEQLLAVGADGEELLVVLRDRHDALLVRRCPARGVVQPSLRVIGRAAKSPSGRLVALYATNRDDEPLRCAFRLGDEALEFDEGRLLRHPATDLVFDNGDLVRLVRVNPPESDGRWAIVEPERRRTLARATAHATRGWFARRRRGAAPWAVVEVEPNRFRGYGDAEGEFTLRAGEDVIAAIDDALFWPLLASPRTPGLVVVDEARTQLIACFPDVRLTILRCDLPISGAALSADGVSLAYAAVDQPIIVTPVRVVADQLWAVAGREASS
ncbi:MAG: hypothetical protein KC609_04290 [Myxococcales bacterium]|nr:hypothetical protein [Myxococcales bacterium]